MKASAWPVANLLDNSSLVLGQVVATNVPDFERGTGYLFHKGDILEAAKLASLATHAPADYSLHLIQMEEGEVSEDTAGLRLAELVAGPGIIKSGPVESRVNLLAKQRGLLRIDVPRLDLINEVPGVAVFTLYDAMAVEAGTEVAGAKVTPLVYPVTLLQEVEKVVRSQPGPLIDVLPFRPLKVGVIVREQLKAGPRARFISAVEQKFNWFGAELLDVKVVEAAAEQMAVALEGFKSRGADLILHVGGHSSDPLDPIFPTLERLGIEMTRHGAPAHPGTLFWLAYWGNTALFGLASCGMFSRTTLGDLFLARIMAGERLTARAIAQMGQGGLFTRDMAFRFPPYGLKTPQGD
ncbi:MAG TPA: hypothetical protein VH186_16470 [Chloroflexia bacterium]|nr:hypothetical protein [Chloroflexia bacterium]